MLRNSRIATCLLVLIGYHQGAGAEISFDQKGLSDETLPKVLEGFEVSVFAKEPDVRNPASLAFDHKGRVFVGQGPQFRYPEEETPGDEILILEDIDSDGICDNRKVFAGGFNNIQSLAWKGTDLWVANAPDLTVVRDLDGDDVADEYLLVYSGLGTLEHALHGLNWAPDGRLYLSKGDTPVQPEAPKPFRDLAHVPSNDPIQQTVRKFNSPNATVNPYQRTYVKPTDPHTEGGVLRLEGFGENLEIFCKGMRNPYDLCFDSEFNWLGTDNDQEGGDKIFMAFQGAHFGHHHPWTYQWTGEDHAPTVPASGPFFHGSGTGVAFYSSPQFPEPYRNVFFIGDWLQMKIYVYRPTWVGALMHSMDPKLEVFAESGEAQSLFRPTDLAVGPDGALYVSGWGKEYGAQWDETGHQENHGRVYRIWAKKSDPESEMWDRPDKTSIAEWPLDRLIVDLNSDLPARCVDAQEELIRRGNSVRSELERVLSSEGFSKSQRTWVAWSLGRMSLMEDSIDLFFLSHLLDESRPIDVRIQSLRILGYRAGKSGRPFPETAANFLGHENPRLRFETVQAMGQSHTTGFRESLLARLAVEEDWITYYSLWKTVQAFLPVEDRIELLGTSPEPRVRLGLLLGLLEKGDITGKEVVHLLESEDSPEVQRWASTWMANVGEGLDRPDQVIQKLLELNQRGIHSELRMNLFRTLERMEILGEDWATLYEGFYRGRKQGEIYIPEKSREAALCLKVLSRDPRVLPLLLEALSDDWEPVRNAAIEGFRILGAQGKESLLENLHSMSDLQISGTIAALIRFIPVGLEWTGNQEQVAALVRAYGSSSDPALRLNVLNLLMQADGQTWLNEGSKSLAASLVHRAVEDSDPRITVLAEALGDRIDLNVRAAKRDPAEIDSVLDLLDSADASHGKVLFFEKGGRAACFACHRVGGEGKTFAPDLSDIRGRMDARTLVQSILEPNSVITEGYRAQLIETEEGDLLTGVPVSETESSLSLVQSDGQAIPIDKSVIVDRRPLETSIMPDNLKDLLTSQEVADIVAWLLAPSAPFPPD